ncbi:uncharacterized protein LOC131315517 isoform X3 [Rhododendron vialii]|uniref:uncharacterized protein LOC131315517 isoform X3 n=1 Tax=Rhododendron vialii TaxID=182163 RepID=UPI00265E45C5|nr:uncharacterized protein LOC131315517 isoform X3 [Rhododendron vialii]
MIELGNCVSMAAPTNSGESDMATEDFCLSLSPLLSPRWSPPLPFLPSSNSMVMQYQGSNQSTDDPPQNQEHDDIVDPAPYLAGDSAMLQQQQLRQNWSEASDWRPGGGGIMTMNNQGFEESNMGFEESMEMTTCFYFPPSPTNFPLYRPMPSVFFVSSEQENISLALSCQHILEDKSGALHVINERKKEISQLLFGDFHSYVHNRFDDLDQIIKASGVLPKGLESLLNKIADKDEMEMTLRRINWLEQHDEDIVDQPVIELVSVAQQLIQNRDGELDVIFEGGVVTINGLELRVGQGSPTAPDTLLTCQAMISSRMWLGHGGQWVVEIRSSYIRLNTGSFTTVEDAISAHEWVVRWSGWEDLTGFPGLFENENRSKLPQQLPLPAQEEKSDEDFGLVCCNAMGNDEIEAVGTGSEGREECVMADQARLNSLCLGKRKTKKKNLGGEKRNKKTNGVRLAIPLENILQTKGMRRKDAAKHLNVSMTKLKSSCREYGIQRWPPHNEHKLIRQSLPNATPAVVDQEGIPHLSSDIVPSNQASMATVDTNNFFEKEILLPQLLPTARQENLDVGFGNDEDEAIGMEVVGTMEGVMVEAQLYFGCSGNGKWKEKSPGGERGKNGTTGVKIAIAKEDILQTKGMHLKDAAKHLEDEDFGNIEAEAVGMGSGGTRQSDMEDDQLNSRYLEKEKMKEMTLGGERRNKKNAISLEDIFQCKEMPQKVVANHLKVGLSTLKRACRGHGIPSWPPCGEHNQSRPNESLAVVDKEPIPQLNSDTLLPSNQVSATIGTKSVTVKARFSTVTLKFQLSWPWRMGELKQQAKKRLGHEAENYYICYKDQDNDDDFLIACDEDLQDHISHSSLPDTNSIEVFLKPK